MVMDKVPKETDITIVPLKNKSKANLMTKKSWEASLCKPPEAVTNRRPEAGQASQGSNTAAAVPQPLPGREGPSSTATAQPVWPCHVGTFHAVEPGALLAPWADDPDGPEECCPSCSATVLPLDMVCAQCGLGRAADEQTAEAPLPAAPVHKPQAQAARMAPKAEENDTVGTVQLDNLFTSGIVQPRGADALLQTERPTQRGVLKSALKGRNGPTSGPGQNRISFADDPQVIAIASMKRQSLWWSEAELAKPRRGRPPGRANASATSATPHHRPRRLEVPPASSANGKNCLSQAGADTGREGLSQSGYAEPTAGKEPKWHDSTLSTSPPPAEVKTQDVRTSSTGPRATEQTRPECTGQPSAPIVSSAAQRLEALRQRVRAREQLGGSQ